MPLYIRFNLEGIGEVTKRLNNISKVVSDLTPAFKKIGNDFRKTEERVFQGQGYYGSRPGWKPLTPKYREWKSIKYPGKPILQATGSLRASLTKRTSQHIEIIRPKSITLGTSNKSFRFHQKGTSKMVARPPITFTRYQGIKWAKIIRDEIMSGGKKR